MSGGGVYVLPSLLAAAELTGRELQQLIADALP